MAKLNSSAIRLVRVSEKKKLSPSPAMNCNIDPDDCLTKLSISKTVGNAVMRKESPRRTALKV